MSDQLKDNIKHAFSKVKENISDLQEELGLQKEVLVKQTEVLKDLKKRLEESNAELLVLKETIQANSKGKDMVNQSFNHLINQSINQSITNQSFNHKNQGDLGHKWGTGTKEVNHLINQSITNQSPVNHLINQSPDSDLLNIKTRLDKTFKSLSKQELKLFLTIYQLEDENLETSYKVIAQKMQLSEHCIRSHISSLMKKNVPLLKKRMSNHINLLSINPDFRALNLKQRLINIFYDSDSHQMTLFDLN